MRKGCVFVREGGKHSVFFNPATRRVSTVPRHKEINNFLVKKICNDLGVASPIRN
ncbi:MAG: type II toxin-antitoxin system HicA family toxin [bacterium]|nr:type II toxin-antitoxin system HicA family toxin [bacterium]